MQEKRIEAIAKMLPEKPAGLGRPAGDRAAWEKLAADKEFRKVIAEAEKLLKTDLPELPDDLYLEFSRTGVRTGWQKVNSKRIGRLRRLVLAECLQNEGRFTPAVEELIAALAAQRTWVMPAHDRDLANFKGTRTDIDLLSSAVGWGLATADWLLGDKLKAETRRLIRSEVRRRIFQPFRQMVQGKRKANWWLRGTNNWNAVCLAGVTGSALALVEPRKDRALFVAAAEEYSKNFLAGFTADGYCSEGVGYWNYGFGHYVLLAEAIFQATGGKLDLFDRKKVRAAAMFPAGIEIAEGIYPAFADCSVKARPDRQLTCFLARRFSLGLGGLNDDSMIRPTGRLFQAVMYCFPNSAAQRPVGGGQSSDAGLRTWFDEGGVLVCRPAPGGKCRLAVALKGGHNAEHHNHNDLGSYVVVVGRATPLVDPGGEVYTARTFSSRRYDSKVINSWGHPVPVVAGKLQRPARDARAKVVSTSFTADRDSLVLDLRSGYDVATLTKLKRTFVYSRKGDGSLTITDEVAFSSPQTFETALVTFGKFEQLAGGRLKITDGGESVTVAVECGPARGELVVEKVRENISAPALPSRIGIRLAQPVAAARVTVTIVPD